MSIPPADPRDRRAVHILTHDGHLDRRIAAYVEPLREMGLSPVIFAGPGEESRGFIHLLRPVPAPGGPNWRGRIARALPAPCREPLHRARIRLHAWTDRFLRPRPSSRHAHEPWRDPAFLDAVYDPRPILRRAERALAAGETAPPRFVLACDLPVLPAAMRLAARHGAPLAVDCHEWWAEQARLFQPGRPDAALVADRFERALYPRCALRITVGETLAEAMGRHFGVPFRTLLSASPPPPPGARALRPLHRRLELPAATRIALFQGSLTPLRNLDALVLAARELAPHQVIAVVGDGTERPRLERLAREAGCADRLRFAGWIAQQDLMAHAAGADLALLPYAAVNRYYAMSCPNKLFEYLSARLPILFDPGMLEIRRIVSAAAVGVAAPAADPAALGRTIAATLGDEPRLAAIERAYDRAGDRFLASAQKDRIKALFAELL